MKIKILQSFRLKFNDQLLYIAEDKPAAARKFRNDVLEKLKDVPSMPYRNRKSIYFNNENVRDLVFKGYIIIYRIKPEQNEIEVFGFIKYTREP
ncbi:type II toxin-antitoxin system RelE/ParE family toxin [Flavobacterium sp. RHBU_3]|uniref:type II toxin-antitoxin system RelE/ParE family toxin n=1 Tax=Flavobacterium sp. RHBU_3 TaxID=3391184 RepID=UPI0039847F85